MNIRRLGAALAMSLALSSSLVVGVAYAGTAYLVSCENGTSVSGAPAWIGTYDHYGSRFRMAFRNYCPNTMDVD